MKSITDVDTNFKVSTSLNKADIRFYDAQEAPFSIYGLLYEDGKFRRIPKAVAESLNENIVLLHSHTAGGRIRFRTDSPYIAIYAEMPSMSHMVHFPFTGSVGFDLYVRENGINRYVKTFIPPMKELPALENIIELDSSVTASGMREFTIHMPLYSDVSRVYIGLSEKASVAEATPYRDLKPIVYYGSSITQGGCASRAGNAYQNIITRRLNVDHINLGFSGNAKGEDEMTEHIRSLDMSVFVLDYDYNAPSTEHLRATHERMFRAIRAEHPALPIVMLSRPKNFLTDEEHERVEIIRKTYHHALESGDQNVYFIEGCDLMGLTNGDGTVDGCHPNDLGFFSMASVLGDLLEAVLKG